MAEYEEVEGDIEVPRNTGIDGFLKVIKHVLKLPRVQRVEIDARGHVTYMYHMRAGEPPPTIDMNFESVQPYGVIRNSLVRELSLTSDNAAVTLGQLFSQASLEQLFPVALVGGMNTLLWDWYKRTTGVALPPGDTVYGLPFLSDRFVEDHVLILCAAYSRHSTLVDTQKSFKLAIQ